MTGTGLPMGMDEPRDDKPEILERPWVPSGRQRRSVVPFSLPAKWMFFWVGVVLPVAVFTIGVAGGAEFSGWRSGEISAYSAVLLSPRTCQVFFPLLLFAIGCFVLLLIDPHEYGQRWGVRMGLYSGVVMAMHLSVLWQLSLVGNFNPYDVEAWLWNIFVICPAVFMGVVVLPCAWWMLNYAAWRSLGQFDWMTLLLAVPAVAVDVGLLVCVWGAIRCTLWAASSTVASWSGLFGCSVRTRWWPFTSFASAGHHGVSICAIC